MPRATTKGRWRVAGKVDVDDKFTPSVGIMDGKRMVARVYSLEGSWLLHSAQLMASAPELAAMLERCIDALSRGPLENVTLLLEVRKLLAKARSQ